VAQDEDPEFKSQYCKIKKDFPGQAHWLKPVILATQEAEIKRIKVQGQPRQKFMRTPSQQMA
jgi:hypothetical protein